MVSDGISVVGMGRVGLVLSCRLANAGFRVYGIESNKEVKKLLIQGSAPFYEPGLDEILKRCIEKRRMLVYDEVVEEVEKNVGAYIICVGTGINLTIKKPTLSDLRKASEDVASHLKKKDLVAVRSTVPVGTTRNLVKKILEKISGLSAGNDFHLAYTPERVVEGAALEEGPTLPQIVGGIDKDSIKKATRIFNRLARTIVEVSSLETAEMIKLVDNTYRSVNIGLGNEIGLMCEILGLDAYEVVNAANYAYRRNDMMVPGAGVGGSCLIKDPWYLIDSANEQGLDVSLSIICAASKLNNYMPGHVMKLVKKGFREVGKDLKGSKILILGFAYKGEPPTDDTRFSPTEPVVKRLKKAGAEVVGYDPAVSSERIEAMGAKVAQSIEEGAKGVDCIVIMTNSRVFKRLNFEELKGRVAEKCVIIDGWHIVDKNSALANAFHYKCIGVGQ